MSALRMEREGRVQRVTIAKPERRNAFDAALIAELHETFSAIEDDVRVVVLAGDGPSFSAGADVEWQRSSIDLSFEENVEDALRLYRMLEAVDSCPAPVVARVQGYALGGGSGLAACADIVVASPGAIFGFTEVRLGIIPAVISPFALAKIGRSAARELFLTGARFSAARAKEIGLVHAVVPADELDAAVQRYVDKLLAAGPEAVAAAKALIRDVWDRPRDEAMPITANAIAERRVSAEGQEGLTAFLEKRAARWSAGLLNTKDAKDAKGS